MPLQRVKVKGKLGWRWGTHGKFYPGAAGKHKALKQAAAIKASGWTENAKSSTCSECGRSLTTNTRNPLKHDPSRTSSLRRKFSVEVRKRFLALRRKLLALVVTEDAFGLKPKPSLIGNAENALMLPPVINAGRWEFRTSAEQAEAFRKWLQEQINDDILDEDDPEKWWAKYVEEGYKKGAGRAFDDTRKPSLFPDKLDWYKGTRDEFLRSSFARPVAVDKVKLLAGRVYTDLKGVTDAMSTSMSRVLVDGLTQGKSPREIGAALSYDVDGIGIQRGVLIARTETIRAHSEGQLDAFEALGVEDVGVAAEWSTANDDAVCEECAPLEGVVMTVDEARGLIPRHPNAVFAGSSFVPYGKCEEIVRAWYCGPAVVLTLRRGLDRTTIGPNHPIMTRRGMVPAAQLREGDYVLRDNRKDRLSVGRDVNQVPMVEDVFGSLLKVAGDSGIVSTSSDLHGDRVFCKGEIQAIRPADGLLSVWDSFGIEKLRKIDFTRTNTELLFRPCLSSSQPGSQRVFLSSPTFMSERGKLRVSVGSESDSHSSKSYLDRVPINSESLFEGAKAFSTKITLPNFFQWERIHAVSFTTYEGLAFDATTATSLYYSGGLVVSNCRCTYIPANVGEDEEDQKRSKSDIEDAFSKSVEAEGGEEDSDWVGADKSIGKERPESILNRSFFADCDRDDKGRCLPAGGVREGFSKPEEQEHSVKIARSKIKRALVPSREEVAKARQELARAARGEGRAGGESRGGSAASRRKQRENLFKEFGGEEKGYVVCPWTGLKMHWTDDPKLNPKGYPKFERGKIFTKKQGGGYQLHNLIPESFAANRARNDIPLRKENLK